MVYQWQFYITVNGQWSNWTNASYTECKVDEDGTWTRPKFRFCNNPEPKFGGQFCESKDGIGNLSTIICEPINGNLTEFGKWSSCYENEGVWFQTAERNCSNAKYGGICLEDEHGGHVISQECLPGSHFDLNSNFTNLYVNFCTSVDGGFSNWTITDDEMCIETSNGSWIKPIVRFCNNPAPKYGGKDCQDIIDCFEDGTDYFGHDITWSKTENAKYCQNECAKNTKCKFWTFVKSNKICYLKKKREKVLSRNQNVTSGPKTCPGNIYIQVGL